MILPLVPAKAGTQSQKALDSRFRGNERTQGIVSAIRLISLEHGAPSSAPRTPAAGCGVWRRLRHPRRPETTEAPLSANTHAVASPMPLQRRSPGPLAFEVIDWVH